MTFRELKAEMVVAGVQEDDTVRIVADELEIENAKDGVVWCISFEDEK